jgi:hypothetical protein
MIGSGEIEDATLQDLTLATLEDATLQDLTLATRSRLACFHCLLPRENAKPDLNLIKV